MKDSTILYSTGCPKCNVLKAKLDNAGIEYTVSDDVQFLLDSGIYEVPVLSVAGELLRFRDAVNYANNYQRGHTNEH